MIKTIAYGACCRLGAALMGMIMSTMLLGVTYTQTFYYYTSKFLNPALRENIMALASPDSPMDSWRLKLLVCTVPRSCLWLSDCWRQRFSFTSGCLHHRVRHCSSYTTLARRYFRSTARSRPWWLTVCQPITIWSPISSASLREYLWKVAYIRSTAIHSPSLF